MHQIHQLTDKIFKKARSLYGRASSFWGDLRAYMNLFYFKGIEEMWLWMIEPHSDPPAQ